MTTLKELVALRDECNNKISAMADALKRENRTRNEKEEREYKTLCRDKQEVEMRINAYAVPTPHPENKRAYAREILECIRENRKTTMQLRDAAATPNPFTDLAAVKDGGLEPVKLQQVLEPLEKGLILDKIGIPMPTGLKGEFVWVRYVGAEATVAKEGVALDDTKIEPTKMAAHPERIGAALPVSNEAINQSEGVIETIITRDLPRCVARTINKIMFGPTKINTATNLIGPFVGKTATNLSAAPTFAELNAMKGAILAEGIEGTNMAFVMNAATKCLLEATPKDKGSGIMICENDKIAGVPVFVTEYIGAQNIGLGDFSYSPVGFFGDINITVDPYTQARKGMVDFVINTDFAITVLRPEAFVLGKLADANDANGGK